MTGTPAAPLPCQVKKGRSYQWQKEKKADWPLIGMSTEEAAAALRVDKKTVIKAVKTLGMPARKVGVSWRFSPDAIDAWLARGRWTPKDDDTEKTKVDLQ